MNRMIAPSTVQVLGNEVKDTRSLDSFLAKDTTAFTAECHSSIVMSGLNSLRMSAFLCDRRADERRSDRDESARARSFEGDVCGIGRPADSGGGVPAVGFIDRKSVV